MELSVYYRQQIDNLLFLIKETKKGLARKDIHQMRVKIKELRALWRLVETVHPDYLDRKFLQQYSRPLFKKAGIVREIQVNLQMLEAHPQKYLQPVRNQWQLDLSKASEEFNVFLQTFDVEKWKFILMETLPSTQSIQGPSIVMAADRLIHKKLNKTNQLQERLPNDHWLHKIRIHLKVIKEILAILTFLGLDRGKKTFRKKINRLSKRLGKWHDEVVFVQEMKKIDMSEMSEWKQKAFHRLVAHHEEKKQKQENYILQQLYRLRKFRH